MALNDEITETELQAARRIIAKHADQAGRMLEAQDIHAPMIQRDRRYQEFPRLVYNVKTYRPGGVNERQTTNVDGSVETRVYMGSSVGTRVVNSQAELEKLGRNWVKEEPLPERTDDAEDRVEGYDDSGLSEEERKLNEKMAAKTKK